MKVESPRGVWNPEHHTKLHGIAEYEAAKSAVYRYQRAHVQAELGVPVEAPLHMYWGDVLEALHDLYQAGRRAGGVTPMLSARRAATPSVIASGGLLDLLEPNQADRSGQ